MNFTKIDAVNASPVAVARPVAARPVARTHLLELPAHNLSKTVIGAAAGRGSAPLPQKNAEN